MTSPDRWPDRATHYIDDRRKLHPEIAGMLGRLCRLTGRTDFAVRRHAPGGGVAFYSVVCVDDTPAGYSPLPRRVDVRGLAALRTALDGLLAGAELLHSPPRVLVVGRWWWYAAGNHSIWSVQIWIDGAPAECGIIGDTGADLRHLARRACAAQGVILSRYASIETIKIEIACKRDLPEVAIPARDLPNV